MALTCFSSLLVRYNYVSKISATIIARGDALARSETTGTFWHRKRDVSEMQASLYMLPRVPRKA